MLLGFVFFAGIFEFAGLGLFAKIALGLLFDCVLWAFVFRREIRCIRNAVVCRRREKLGLRVRAEAKHESRRAANYYNF